MRDYFAKFTVTVILVCLAVHKRQVIKLRNCCIWLVHLFQLYDDARTCKR